MPRGSGSTPTVPSAASTPFDYFAVSGSRAVTKPKGETHTAPLTTPGSLSPSPVSELMVAINLPALGLDRPPFLTYPGQRAADTIAVVTVAPTVVFPPEFQSMVPPLGMMVKKKGRGFELPPVFPPVHPLMVIAL